ncbi:hypothetical protein QAO71_17890 (plasmid) [Halopseudomonas sp. SMJS2]|uniref:hypothetical protein n=1 Tax=Halopseudomonas sp. SMJS2 TaxID=3041098 RepID=UPI002452C6AD|nr:hypothetical protein [Halopseudomonas sp. SMJS2]WGK63414.1 hypothetical protein QAO71_17890 [Halopseudomonas sp. SMJS2]
MCTMMASISNRVTDALQKSLHPGLGLGNITPELTFEAAEIMAQHLADFGFHVCERNQLDHGVALTMFRHGQDQMLVDIDVTLLLIPGHDGRQSVRVGFRRDCIPSLYAGALFEGYSRVKGQWYGVLSLEAPYPVLIKAWVDADPAQPPHGWGQEYAA